MNFATKFYISNQMIGENRKGCKITFVRDQKSGDKLWTGNFPDRLLSFGCLSHIFRWILLFDIYLIFQRVLEWANALLSKKWGD